MKMAGRYIIKISLVIILLIFNLSCISTPHGPTPFEQYCSTFSQKKEQIILLTNDFDENISRLSVFEKNVGSLMPRDYDEIESFLESIPKKKLEIENEIKNFKDFGQSITSEGFFTGTKNKIKGWDPVIYAGLGVENNLLSIDKRYSDTLSAFQKIDSNLIKRPNKPFSKTASDFIAEAKVNLAAAKTDVSAKNYSKGKENIDRVNNALNRALRADPNDIQQYQIGLVQKELEPVASDVRIGETVNKAGSLIEGGIKSIFGIK